MLLSIAMLGWIDRLQDPHRLDGTDAARYANESALLRQCAMADAGAPADRGLAQRCASIRSHPIEPARIDWWGAQLIDPASGLNALLRIGRILLLGTIALCLAELILHALRGIGVPVSTMAELLKSAGTGERPSAQRSEDKGGMAAVIGTTIVTGVTSLTTITPELVQQHVRSERVADVRTTETTIRSERTIVDPQQLRQLEVSQRALETKFDSMSDRWSRVHDALDQRVKAMPDAADWNAVRALRRDGIKVNVLQDDSRFKALETQLAAAQAALRGVEALAERGFAKLGDELHATDREMRSGFGNTSAELERAREQVRRRTCAMLAYFEHLESHRVLYAGEARDRIQKMREQLDAALLPKDCGGRDGPPAPSQQARPAEIQAQR